MANYILHLRSSATLTHRTFPTYIHCLPPGIQRAVDLLQPVRLFLLMKRSFQTPGRLFHFMNRKREIHHKAWKQTFKSFTSYFLTVKSSRFKPEKIKGKLEIPLSTYSICDSICNSLCNSLYATNQVLHILSSYLTLDNNIQDVYYRIMYYLSSVERGQLQ